MGRIFFGGGKVGMKMGGSRLPKGYTELAYIQSSGTQYIDTGFRPNQNTRVVMDVQVTKSGTTSFFGARTSAWVATYTVWQISQTQVRVDYGTTQNYVSVNTTLDRVTIDMNGANFKFGNYTQTCSTATFQCSYPIFLFNVNSAGRPENTNYASMKIYNCQIYDNGTLVRDFVPCLSDTNGVGLYDLVNNKFYGNAGSGSFIGSEVA